jgi:hypothetical protein
MQSRIYSLAILVWAALGCGSKHDAKPNESDAAVTVEGGTSDVTSERRADGPADAPPFEAYIPPYFVGTCDFASSAGAIPSGAGTLPYGLTVLATGLKGIIALEVDSSNAYFATATTLSRMSLSGGAPEVMVAGVGPVATALDANNLYWSDSSISGQTTILSVPLSASGWQAFADGGAEKTATRLASQTGSAGAFALADGYLYFGVGNGVWRVPTAGGTATTVVTGIAPKGIAVRGDIVYLADDPNEAIQQVQLTGQYAGVLGGFKASYVTPKQIAVNGGDLYWGDWYGSVEYVAIAAPGSLQLFSTPCHGGACQLNLVRPAGTGVVWESGESSCSNVGIATPSGATWYAISIAKTKAIAASGTYVYAATSAGELLRWSL